MSGRRMVYGPCLPGCQYWLLENRVLKRLWRHTGRPMAEMSSQGTAFLLFSVYWLCADIIKYKISKWWTQQWLVLSIVVGTVTVSHMCVYTSIIWCKVWQTAVIFLVCLSWHQHKPATESWQFCWRTYSKVRFFHSKLISRWFNPALNPADNDQFTQMSFFHRQFVN